MTNKTIDGVLVSREQLVRWEEMLRTPPGRQELLEDLRALLDADKVNNRQMGLMQYVEAHPIKPVAQPQGEPVAWMVNGKVYDNQSDANHNSAYHSNFKDVLQLYAEQHTPVAVVLPERQEVDKYGEFYDSGWNDCLDEVKRLNP